MDDRLLEPVEFYNSFLKDKFLKSCEDYFEKLVKDNKVDVEANKQTCNKLYKEQENIENTQKDIQSKKSLKGFLIFVCIASILAAIIGLFSIFGGNFIETTPSILMAVFGILLFVGMLLLIIKVVNPKIKNFEQLLKEAQARAQKYLNEANAQLAQLNSSYEFDIPNKLINENIDVVKMDKNVDPKKYYMLLDKYKFIENLGSNESVLSTQSGSILGNPFLIRKYKHFYWGSKTYTGSITIYWTTTERDSNGNYYTQQHSEVLTASVTKPFPEYTTRTELVYGNEAAPDLSFSRTSNTNYQLEGNQLSSFLKKFDKKLDKMVRKDINPSDGSQFTKLANTEFEALFQALDRDNEVQFRLLFTPLAQKNEIDLLRKSPFNDDFSFVKKKMINIVSSSHSQSFDFSANPARYVSFDLEVSRDNFINYVTSYFKNFFFDLAPMISIPLYQQYKTREYIYNHEYKSNFTFYEHETLANKFSIVPPKCVTDVILKTSASKIDDTSDIVRINSVGYEAIPQVSYIPVHGGDGYMHDVPVEWDRYDEVSCSETMCVGGLDLNRKEYNSLSSSHNNIKYNKGLLAVLGKSMDGLMKK